MRIFYRYISTKMTNHIKILVILNLIYLASVKGQQFDNSVDDIDNINNNPDDDDEDILYDEDELYNYDDESEYSQEGEEEYEEYEEASGDDYQEEAEEEEYLVEEDVDAEEVEAEVVVVVDEEEVVGLDANVTKLLAANNSGCLWMEGWLGNHDLGRCYSLGKLTKDERVSF